MKRLGFFRHAKSSWKDRGLRDYDRPLNERGRRAAARMGRHICEHGLGWERVLASPAARVRETVEAAAKEAGTCPPVEWIDRMYLAGPEMLTSILREVDDRYRNIMLCGHNPGMQQLLLDLSGSGARADDRESSLRAAIAGKFPTGSFAVLELDIESWTDLASGCGRVTHFTRPRDLDAGLGPERDDA